MKGSKVKPTFRHYIEISNAYSLLAELLAESGPPSNKITTATTAAPSDTRSNFKQKAAQRCSTRADTYLSNINYTNIIDMYINKAEDEHTVTQKTILEIGAESQLMKRIRQQTDRILRSYREKIIQDMHSVRRCTE